MALIATSAALLDALGTLPGVRIVDVAGRCRAGVGRLAITAAGLARWRAPRSLTWGPYVDVSAGGDFYLADGEDAGRWLLANVTAAWLGGAEEETGVIISEQFDNAVSHADVTAAQAAAGLIDDWTFTLTNLTAGAVTLLLYLDVYTAPRHTISINGADYSAPLRWEDGLELAFSASETKTIYARRTIPAGDSAHPGRRVRVRWRAVAGAITEFGEVNGLYRVFGAAHYRIYMTDGRDPLPGRDVPVETCTSLPFTLTDPPGDGDWRIAVTRHNGAWESPPATIQRLRIASSAEGLLPPSGPQDLQLEQRAGGVVRVHALYPYRGDPPSQRATHWNVSVSVDEAPAQAVAIPVTAPRGMAVLAYDLPAQSDAAVQAVTVEMNRIVGELNVVSTISLTESITTRVPAPAAPAAAGFLAGQRE